MRSRGIVVWWRPSLILLAALFGLAPGVARADSWDTVVAGPARVRYHAKSEADGRRAVEAARDAASRIAPEIGLAAVRPFTVVLHPTHADFTRAVGIGRRELVVGIASGEYLAHVDASEHLADLPTTVAHEVAHLLLAQAVGDAMVPRWFDEGHAEHVSRRVPWSSQERLAGLGTGQLLPLEELTETFPRNDETAGTAYAQSHALVAYILENSPPRALADLVAGVRAGQAFEDALANVTGHSSREWDERWRRDFRGRFRWYPWIALGAGASGIAMAALCVLAFRAIRRRKERLSDNTGWGPHGYGIAIRRRRR